MAHPTALAATREVVVAIIDNAFSLSYAERSSGVLKDAREFNRETRADIVDRLWHMDYSPPEHSVFCAYYESVWKDAMEGVEEDLIASQNHSQGFDVMDQLRMNKTWYDFNEILTKSWVDSTAEATHKFLNEAVSHFIAAARSDHVRDRKDWVYIVSGRKIENIEGDSPALRDLRL